MKRKKSHLLHTVFTGAVIAVLLLTGTILAVRQTGQTRGMILSSKDLQLTKIAQSVDNDILGHFRWYASDLEALTERKDFLAAEQTRQMTGESGDLLNRLKEASLPREYVSAVIACTDDRSFLATDADRYRMGENLGKTSGMTLRLAYDTSGNIHLAICLDRGNAVYAAVLDIENFFATTENQSAAGAQDSIMLMDAARTIFLHRDGENIHIHRILEMTENEKKETGLSCLLDAHNKGESITDSFYLAYSEIEEAYNARVSILPASLSNNRCFTVGVVNNNEEFTALLQRSLLGTASGLGLIGTGIMMLLIFLMTISVRSRASERELIALREKKTAMEELTRKTMELAHHQRLETIGTLTSSISHEFNNLLTPIMGYSLMTLEDLPPDSELYENVLEIYNSSQRAKGIISRLSDMARKNSSAIFAPICPDELVRKTLAVARPAQPTNVLVTTDLNCAQTQLCCNEIQLSQMLLNLVLNAFQAMETGGKVRISTRTVGQEVVFEVADNGPGVAEDVLPHIFEPFYTTKGSGKGTGLGLAIVRQVVEDHGGRIDVTSKKGSGTCITAIFPLRRPENREDL